MSSERLDTVRNALDVLSSWPRGPREKTLRAADEAPAVVCEEIRDRGVWDGLLDADRAALHWSMARGCCMAAEGLWPSFPDTGAHGELISEVAYFASLCDSDAERWPEADTEHRAAQAAHAVEHLARFDALPAPWQEHVLKTLEPGTENSYLTPAPPPPTVGEVLAHAEARREDKPPTPPYRAGDWWCSGKGILRRLRQLPGPGWQAEVFRRIANGSAPLSTIATADDCTNMIRAYSGYLGWIMQGFHLLPRRMKGAGWHVHVG